MISPTQQKAKDDFHAACERLANASVALRRAQVEYDGAMSQYNETWGAAKQAGVLQE